MEGQAWRASSNSCVFMGVTGSLKKTLSSETKPLNKSQPVALPIGTVLVGRDGRIHVFKSGNESTIRSFDASGELQSTFKLQPPYNGALGAQMFLWRNRALVPYQRPTTPESERPPDLRIDYVVYDLTDGKPLLSYRQDKGGVFACMDGDDVLWLTASRDGFFEVRRGSLP